MPRKTKDGQPFFQNAYIEQWKKENMTCLSVRYKKEFVQSFRDACKKLGIKQSDVYREGMQAVIDQANKRNKAKNYIDPLVKTIYFNNVLSRRTRSILRNLFV